MTTVREAWAGVVHLAVPAAAVLLLGWVLLGLLVEVLVWGRAWRHARTVAGCTGCGAVRVDVVAYPSRTDPRPYCMRCVAAWPARGQQPPMVGLRRPVDPAGLFGQAGLMFVAVLTAAVLITWTVGS